MSKASKQQVVHPSQQLKNFDNLRNILKNSKSKEGPDLYEHLVEVVDHIVLHCPDEGLDKIEEISFLLKNQDKISMEDYLRVDGNNHYSKPNSEIRELTMKYLSKAKKVFEVSYN